jgi:hypothetical protein
MKNGAHSKRILGRRLAREMTRQEIEQTSGDPWATMTFRWPPDIDPGWHQIRM